MAKPAMASTTPVVILSVNSLPSPSSMADSTSRPMILTCREREWQQAANWRYVAWRVLGNYGSAAPDGRLA